MHATPARRRIAGATMALGTVFLGISLFAPSANAGVPAPREYSLDDYDTLLNEGQLGATADSKDNDESCPTDESVAGLTVWHFVLEGSAQDNVFDSLTVTFLVDGNEVELTLAPVVVSGADLATFDWSSFDKTTEFIATPDGKHAYVYTGGDGTAVVVDAAAQVSGADPEPSDKFQLSHTCPGGGGGDDGGDTTTGEVQATTGGEQPETEVLGNVVEPQQLPKTGDNDASLAIVGTALVLIGGGVLLIRRNMVPGS